MFPILINPLPLLLTLTTTFGVLVHDTQIDRATTTALALPAAFATFGAADAALKFGDAHTHVERVNAAKTLQELRSGQPRMQARNDDEKKFVFNKKFTFDSGGSQYSWPSV
jgi:hypothetical protein